MTTTTMVTMIMMVMMMMASGTEGTTNCTAFTTGEASFVTCHFDQDIAKADLGFRIRFYFRDPSAEPEMALEGSHLQSGEINYKSAKDVRFIQVTANEIKISRDPAKDKVGGRYQCQILPEMEGTTETCILIASAAKPRPQTTVKPEDIVEKEEGIGNCTGVLIVVIVQLVVIFFGCIVLIILCKKRKRIRKWWTEPSTQTWKEYFGDPSKLNLESGVSPRIPEGIPKHFYSLGWQDAHKKLMKAVESEVAPIRAMGQGEPDEIVGEVTEDVFGESLMKLPALGRTAVSYQNDPRTSAGSPEPLVVENLDPSDPMLKGEQPEPDTEKAEEEIHELKKKRCWKDKLMRR